MESDFGNKFEDIKDSTKLEQQFWILIESKMPQAKEKIKQAFAYSKEKHEGQERDEGTPYYSHCIATAINLLEYTTSPTEDQVCIALLHDTLEDTNATYDELMAKFGNYVAEGVQLLSKKRDGKKISNDEYYDGLRGRKDLIDIKGSDRLANIFSIVHSPSPQKQERYLRETRANIIGLVSSVHEDFSKVIASATDMAEKKIREK